jgi:hypothetical protein
MLATISIVTPVAATLAHAQTSPARSPASRLAVAGRWSGADWGDVVIGGDGSGSYTSTYGTGPGQLQIRRAGERTYEGTWSESSQRYGALVLELAPDGRTITGAWRPDSQSTIGSRTGGPVVWTRR